MGYQWCKKYIQQLMIKLVGKKNGVEIRTFHMEITKAEG